MNGPINTSVRFVPQLTGARFFTVPNFGKTIEETQQNHLRVFSHEHEEIVKDDTPMRFAAYIRVSSEQQVGNFSLDAQKRLIEQWIQARGNGQLVKVYVEEGQTGRTLNRSQFRQMRLDASRRLFDAVVVHKFDRFARNRVDALAIKSLFRQEYGIKIFSVSEPSEDSDGPMGALIEGVMESVADWYSRNLATEVKKGKRERAMQGYHNNQAPFGYDKDGDGVLVPNEHEATGLQMAFEWYATGQHSDRYVARELNEAGYQNKRGKPFSKDGIREMLQNRTYLGYVKYQPYERHADGRRSWKGKVEWYEGKHQAIISTDLFQRCQKARHERAIHHKHYPKYQPYLLRGLAFCAECVENMPDGVTDEDFGKMRPHSHTGYRYYRCRARDFGRACSQTSSHAHVVEEQVVTVLKNLTPPPDWRAQMIKSMSELLGDQNLEERIAEIKQIIDRMDFRWDQGFITDKDKYLEERVKLQQELEQLTPIPDDDLEQAADVLENFSQHWEALDGDMEAQEELIRLIVARVWVKDNRVVALSLRPNYHVAVGLDSTKSTEFSMDFSDCDFVHKRGRRAWFAHRVPTLPPFLWVPPKRAYHVVISEILTFIREGQV